MTEIILNSEKEKYCILNPVVLKKIMTNISMRHMRQKYKGIISTGKNKILIVSVIISNLIMCKSFHCILIIVNNVVCKLGVEE